MGSTELYWVVQRNSKTGALITFRSFPDYADALKHKTELEAIADTRNRVSVVAIETLPPVNLHGESMNVRKGAASARQLTQPVRALSRACRRCPIYNLAGVNDQQAIGKNPDLQPGNGFTRQPEEP